ncbi:MAG: UMP kinase [Lachnospiraceae bacterium]|nr:UMP kinase [Lachnospiraceae bacterium]
MARYKRILLKLSGEALSGDKANGFDDGTCRAVAQQIKTVVESGTEVAIVIGGGNFWRGRTGGGIDRLRSDQIGMLATVMNCIYMSETLRGLGVSTQVYTPFLCGDVTKLFYKDDVMEDLKNGRVVFFAGGTGHPFFSTDTPAAIRAIELGCDAIFMAKTIDGVYSADPKVDPSAVKYDSISLKEVIAKGLKVIDQASAVLCSEHSMPLVLFALDEKNSIIRNASGEHTGTVITAE